MKRILSLVIVLCMMLVSIPTAAATGNEFTASNLKEFVEALEAAEDGDIIIITSIIHLTDEYPVYGNENATITIKPAEEFSATFYVFCTELQNEDNAITLQNLIFDGGDIALSAIWFNGTGKTILNDVAVKGFNSSWTQLYINQGATVAMNDCIIQDSEGFTGIQVFSGASLTMTDCEISACLSARNAGAIKNGGTLILSNCELYHNQAGYGTTDFRSGGAIENMGVCTITGGHIFDNTATTGGGIYNSGTLTLQDVFICGNISTRPHGSDLFNSYGSLTVQYEGDLTDIYADEELTPLGWYTDFFEQDSVYYGESFTTTDNLALRFVLQNNMLPEPEEPDPPTPDEPEPVDPPEDDPAPELPVEPDEPDEPEPYTPYIPPRPVKPSPAPEPEPEPLVLSCGGAELDINRTVVLYGYGDGILHEDDILTRAQGATLIYRLLTADSIATLHALENDFSDVDSDMWHNEAVSTIAAAGVVQGTGGSSFDPDGTLTWAQLVTLTSRFIAPQSTKLEHISVSDHWCDSYVQTAVFHGWLEDNESFDPDKPVTRGEAVEYINDILTACRG